MIVLCSLSDRAEFRGTVYATTMKPVGALALIECLRPTRELVYGVKYHGQSEEWYIEGYRALLASRWPAVKTWLESLSPDVDATLVCYCRRGAFCHRQLIAQMLAKHRPDVPLLIR